jgi:arylsulfatase
MDGVSMISTFASAKTPETRTTQYFEMLGNRAIYHDGWMAASRSGLLPWVYSNQPPPDPNKQPWELYDLRHDFSEADNIASQNPQKLKELSALFDTEAKRNNVYPIDPRFGGRQPRPTGTHFRYYSTTGHLYLSLTPEYENRSHTITAYINVPKENANGVLVADGAESGGFSLFLKDGRPTYTYNYFKRAITTISSPETLPPGPATITLQFDYQGKTNGGPADIHLKLNGREVASAHLPATVPTAFSFEDTFDIGQDTASPVGDYEAPFPFTGTIDHIDFDINPSKN